MDFAIIILLYIFSRVIKIGNNTWTLFYLKKAGIEYTVDFHYNLACSYCDKINPTLPILKPVEPAEPIPIINLIDSPHAWKSENS